MKKFQDKFYKNIIKSLKRIDLTVFLLLLIFIAYTASGTDSLYSDSDTIEDAVFETGNWVPVLSISISPDTPDRVDGYYSEGPCIKLFSEPENVIIHYSFSGEYTTSGTVLADTCIYPPVGESLMSAYAVSDENPDWISPVVSQEFRVSGNNGSAGAVIINEVMWMGSYEHTQDEWIELRNIRHAPVDISGWQISNALVGSRPLLIPEESTIPAQGYYLIASTDDAKKTGLAVTPDLVNKKLRLKPLKNGNLILQNKDEKTSDIALGESIWPAGWHGFFLHISMSRNDNPGDGLMPDNWHTTLNQEANSSTYWKEEKYDYGTPGYPNLPDDGSVLILEEKLKDVFDAAKQPEGLAESTPLDANNNFNLTNANESRAQTSLPEEESVGDDSDEDKPESEQAMSGISGGNENTVEESERQQGEGMNNENKNENEAEDEKIEEPEDVVAMSGNNVEKDEDDEDGGLVEDNEENGSKEKADNREEINR